MRKKQFLVIGLGRFGSAVATTLFELGHEVVAVDQNENAVQEIMNRVTHAAIVDAADEQTLRNLGVDSFDTVVVAIGSNVEANIYATLAAKDAGAKRIVCKAIDDVSRRILLKLGADRVIRPEHDSGVDLAYTLASPKVLAEITLTTDTSVIELEAGPELVGNLGKLDLGQRFGVQVIAQARGETVITSLSPQSEVQFGDKLVLVGRNAALEKLRERIGD
jgi:trk system potassium uptake protein TrkA